MAFASTVTVDEIESLEMATFPGEITVVSSGKCEEFEQAMAYLGAQEVIGFDTETKPCFVPKVPRNKMAILQLSGPDKAYIFRLQQVGVPPKLAALLGNPGILKIVFKCITLSAQHGENMPDMSSIRVQSRQLNFFILYFFSISLFLSLQ